MNKINNMKYYKFLFHLFFLITSSSLVTSCTANINDFYSILNISVNYRFPDGQQLNIIKSDVIKNIDVIPIKQSGSKAPKYNIENYELLSNKLKHYTLKVPYDGEITYRIRAKDIYGNIGEVDTTVFPTETFNIELQIKLDSVEYVKKYSEYDERITFGPGGDVIITLPER